MRQLGATKNMESINTLHSLFEAQVISNPRSIALIDGNHSHSYCELNKKANQLAHYLIKQGIKKDQPIVLCLDRSINVLITMLAILKAGAAYLPIDPAHPKDRLLFILQDSKTPLLITQSAHKQTFNDFSGKVIVLDQEEKQINQQKSNNPNIAINPERLAYIIYTSGSTGIPKGVLIEHKSAVNYCHWLADYSGLKAGCRIDFSSNHIFDMAVTSTSAALALGFSIVLCQDEVKMNPKLYLQHLKNQRVNVVKMTPSYFKVLVQDLNTKPISLPKLQSIIMGGEAISSTDCRLWLAAYPNQIIYNEYGPTEATVGVSVFAVSSANVMQLEATVPIGVEGPNIQCPIFTDKGKLAKAGETGELYIGGLCLARGYLNQTELTNKYFLKNPSNKNQRLYKTGDLCLRTAKGVLEYVGRIDDQVKIRGFRIEPAEVEKHLSEHPLISAAVVVAQKDFLGQNQLIAYYIPKDDSAIVEAKGIRQFLQTRIPDYMIPALFIGINAIPLTANGKLDKGALPKPELDINRQYQVPVTATEKALAQIWSKELGINSIGLDDDFFELGGHSLAAGRIVSMINSYFSKDISVHALYQAPTIAQLANIVDEAKNSKRATLSASKRWLNKIDDIPLSDFQFLFWMSHTFENKIKKLNVTLRKRLNGHVNKEALTFALNALIQKQEPLSYHILRFRPGQMLCKKTAIPLEERQLNALNLDECEQQLEQSYTELETYNHWTKKSPLIKVRLFYLPDNQSELQFCLPHTVADDHSPYIILDDLSHFYALYQSTTPYEPVKIDRNFREYVFKEQFYFRTDLNKDIQFWNQYLKDTALITFAPELIVKKMAAKGLNYSTYLAVPSEHITKLKLYCAEQRISIIDGLIAIVTLALITCNPNHESNNAEILMNIVKSTRDNSQYDESVGCFLRIEPVKIRMQEKATLESLTKQIHQSTIETSPHQRCPSIIKLASTKTVNNSKKPLLTLLIKSLASLYAILVKAPQIYRKIFDIGGVPLAKFSPKNTFLININMQQPFIDNTQKSKKQFFGLKTHAIQEKHNDILHIDNVLDICFLRKDFQNTAYLVISANLNPIFRQALAKEIMRIMGATVESLTDQYCTEL